MAVLARRNFVQIRDEVILRCGNITATGFSGRVEYAVAAAYDYICTLFHHFELDASGTVTCSTSNNYVDLPAGTYIVVKVLLRNAGNTDYVGEITDIDVRANLGDYLSIRQAGMPKRAGRFGNRLYFDYKPDAAYKAEVFYYSYPTAPDFSGSPTSPVTARDVDEYIVNLAVAVMGGAIKDVSLAAMNRDLLAEWAAAQVRNPIGVPLPDFRERPASNSLMGGAQG